MKKDPICSKAADVLDKIEALKREEKRNREFLHITVNENQLSKTANHFLNSKLSERYYFGGGKDGVIDFGSYTFLGMPDVAALVQDAEEALKQMTKAEVVNLSCFSGLHAMMCAILSTTEPGDTVMSLRFEDGGHGATEGVIKSLGRKHVFAKFDLANLRFDIDETTRIFKESGAKALYIDISVHLDPVNIRGLREALGEKALIIFDASHSFGLVLGQQFASPLEEGANVMCSNTHKTFAGGQRGVIIFRDKELGERADFLIKTTYTSSVHTAELIALCISILEYAEFGEEYAKQVIKNSRALARSFIDLGHEVRVSNNGEYSNNEQVHVFIDKIGERSELYKRLVDNKISTNFMQILGGRAFARLGTQELTRRGMKENDMKTVATFVHLALNGESVQKKVHEFNEKFEGIHYSFDR